MGTPRFGILTYPYPYRYGESPYQYGDCPFFAFFSHAQDRPFLAKQTTTHQTLLQRSPFLMRGMRQGAPRSSRRALTPRCPPTRPKRRGCGFGRGGGRGGRGPIGRLACACWSAPPPMSLVTVPRRRRRCRRVWGGCLFVPGGELNEIKKSKKTRLCYGRLAKHNNQPKTHARDAGGKCEEVRPVRSKGGARFDRWGR
jgi:hypothetical protein